MPMRTGVSPRAWMMKGDATCSAPIAAPALRMDRRRIDAGHCPAFMKKPPCTVVCPELPHRTFDDHCLGSVPRTRVFVDDKISGGVVLAMLAADAKRPGQAAQ